MMPSVVPAHDVSDRLNRIEGYLRDDPNNDDLLVEVFNCALQAGQFPRAEFYLRHALTLWPGSVPWALREADFLVTQKKYTEAARLLQVLNQKVDLNDEVKDLILYNLAAIDYELKAFEDCGLRLTERMNRFVGCVGFDAKTLDYREIDLALSKLWLRSLHHKGDLKLAVEWIQLLIDRGSLHPALAGIGSLIAFDNQQLTLAQQWANLGCAEAMRTGSPVEVFVTMASLALGERDIERARQFCMDALNRNPNEGRSLSVLGFCDLLSEQPSAACVNFEKALSSMPAHVGTLHGIGWAQIISSQLDAASHSFRKAIDIDRNFAESHGGLAIVLALQERKILAAEQVELSLRLDRNTITGRFARSLLNGEVNSVQAVEALVRGLLEADLFFNMVSTNRSSGSFK